jgi:hypothetical protein
VPFFSQRLRLKVPFSEVAGEIIKKKKIILNDRVFYFLSTAIVILIVIVIRINHYD